MSGFFWNIRGFNKKKKHLVVQNGLGKKISCLEGCWKQELRRERVRESYRQSSEARV